MDDRDAQSDAQSEAQSDAPAKAGSDEGGAPPPGDDLPLRVAPDVSPTGERVDEDGLPLDRPATLDDVRSDAGSGRIIAIGCSLFIAIVLALFWLIRAGLLG